MNEDDEDVWDEDSAYLEMLANEGARLREKSEMAEEGGEDSDDDDEDQRRALVLQCPGPPYASFGQALTN
ncbi:hypothetical protein B0H14DRAFT_2761488, partial [Mycena olivaceomarginata]